MKLNDPNTDSAQFEELESLVNNLDSRRAKLANEKDRKRVLNIFHNSGLYLQQTLVVNVIHCTPSNGSAFFILHIVIDLGYDNGTTLGARDLGVVEHLWGLKVGEFHKGEVLL